MMNVNQSVLASAVINITGNTRGLDHAINQTRKQMQGFLVFANAIGGKTGGVLANMFAAGAAGPAMKAALGANVGGKATNLLAKLGLAQDPLGDVAAAMDRAKRQFNRDLFAHKMAGAGIAVGNMYNGRPLQDAQDVKIARLKHSMNAPKMADYTQNMVSGAAEGAQNLALVFAKVGLVASIAAPVFKRLTEAGTELDRHVRRASRVFGSSLGVAASGFSAGSNMSKSQFLAGASEIGQELTGQGIGRGQASGMSSSMTRRAGQVASAWGAAFEDVAGDIQAALGGSNTALKKFGVILSDDLVRANAFNSGMIKYLEVMSASIAAQSRFNLIMAQTNDVAKNASVGFFDLGHQWSVMTKGFSTLMQQLGSVLTPVAAGVLGVANAFLKLQVSFNEFLGRTIGRVYQAAKNALGLGGNANDPAIDKRALLAQADQDAGRAEQAIQRERARQSSNVGFHRPEDFYNHIQKGIFGDPAEFQKRQTDLMHEFVIVSKEQLAVLRDFGYKVKDGSALLQP